jgi:hypothetical protein
MKNASSRRVSGCRSGFRRHSSSIRMIVRSINLSRQSARAGTAYGRRQALGSLGGMVRRGKAGRSSGSPDNRAARSRTTPTGESPVQVSAEAPGSRSQAPGEIPVSRAGRRKPGGQRQLPDGEQARGPQHEVKPAASTEKQSESRAAHFTVKAISNAAVSEAAADLGGVLGAARVQGEVRNTRGPSLPPSSRQGGSYKPRAKSSAAERESEGRVVLTMAATNNAAGRKAPCGGYVQEAGNREGMPRRSGPNHPDGHPPVDK